MDIQKKHASKNPLNSSEHVINDGDDVSSEPVVGWPYLKDPLENDNYPSKPNSEKSGEGSVKDTHLSIFGTEDDSKESKEELDSSEILHDSHVFEHVGNSFSVVIGGASEISTKVTFLSVIDPVLDLLFSCWTEPVFEFVMFENSISPLP